MQDTPPPQSVDAERAIISLMIHDPGKIPEILEHVPPGRADWFNTLHHQAAFEVLCDLHRRNKAIDRLVFKAELHRRGFDERFGADSANDLDIWLDELRNGFNPWMVPEYGRILRDKHLARELLRESSTLRAKSLEPGCDPEVLAEHYGRTILRLADEGIAEPDPGPLTAINENLIDDAESDTTSIKTVPTGFSYLDVKLNGGMRPGQMLVIGARTSIGKTSLGLQIATHVADAVGIPTIFFSLEMQDQAIARRRMAQLTRIPSCILHRRDPISGYNSALLKEHAETTLIVDDRAGRTCTEIHRQILRAIRKHKIGFAVVDYLGLIRDPEGERQSRVTAVSNVSRDLMQTAKQAEIPLLALHQLNRQSANDNRPPQLHDLRDSGSVEQDAHVVMLLHRKDYKDEESPRVQDILLYIRKNREGACGQIPFTFDSFTQRFEQRPGKATAEQPTEPEPEPEVAAEQSEIPF